MKLSHVFLNRALPAIGGGGQAPLKVIKLGQQCNAAYGGGQIVSLTYERSQGSLSIKKNCRFMVNGGTEFFDRLLVPWVLVEYAYALEDEPVQNAQAPKPPVAQAPAPPAKQEDDPPPAKPIPAQPKGK